MELIDRIESRMRRLPKTRQQEVLDFVEFLLTKNSGNGERAEERFLARALLATEMSRLEEEEGENAPVYSIAEIKATYR